jgi:hypothetical protein
MSDDEENNSLGAIGGNGRGIGAEAVPHINVTQMSNAIANRIASSRQHNIPFFSGSKGEDPIKFIRIFERVGKALKWDDTTMMDKLPNYLTDAAEEFHYMYVDCAVSEDEDNADPDLIVKPSSWEALKKSFMNHFLRGDYKRHLTKELRERKKRPDESMTVYITAIQTICHDLDKNMSTEQIMSYILEGIDEEIAAQIQYFNPKSISELISIARNVELGHERLERSKAESSGSKTKKSNALLLQNNAQKSFKNENKINDPVLEAVTKLSESINALTIDKNPNKNNKFNNNSYKRNFKSNFQRNSNSFQNRNSFNNNINANNNSNNNSSFNRNYNSNNRNGFYQNTNNNNNQFRYKSRIQCFNCKRIGHKQNECRFQNADNHAIENKNSVSTSSTETNAINRVGINSTCLNLQSNENKTLILINVKIKNMMFKALIDTGSEITIMRKSVADILNLKLEPYVGPNLEAVNKHIIKTYGKIDLELSVESDKSYSIKTPILVVDELPADLLLGIDSLMKLNIQVDCSHKKVLIGKKSINCILTSIEQLNGKIDNVSALNMQKNTIYANSSSGAHSCAFVNKTDRNFDYGNIANENHLENENSGKSQTFANSSEKIIPLNSGHSESEVKNKLDISATV